MGKQYGKTICLNGHHISDYYKHANDPNPPEYCQDCGEQIIATCQKCGTPLLGREEIDGVSIVGFGWVPIPKYCRSCSKPYPWTTTILESAVELLSLDDELSDTNKELIKTAIPDLLVDTPKTKLAEAKFKKGIAHASKLVKDSLYNLLVDVLSESVKKVIFQN